jgi:hypothetical protein
MAGTVRAQVPSQAPQPVTGFVPGYEIARIARSAGFDPLAPPLREGTSYVVRATDFRGILMRVVIDARSGAIRDVSRIVPGPGRYGQFYGPPSIYDPADLDAPTMARSEAEMEPALGRPPLPRASAHAADFPPLPRPRPAALLARKDLDRARPPASSEANSAPPAPAAPKKTPLAVEPLND